MPSLALFTLLAVCACYDLRQRRLPNVLTLGGFIAAGLYLLISGHSVLGAPLSSALMSLVLALLLSLPGYALNRLGGGDVKLLALLGLASHSLFLLHCIIGAGITYLLWGLTSRAFWPRLPPRWQSHLEHVAPHHIGRYPYAPFIFVGALLASL